MARYVGDLPVFYDEDTRTLQVDEEALRDAVGAEEDYGEDDDELGEDDDELGEDDDELGDDDEVGLKGRGRRRRSTRRARRQGRREDRREGRHERREGRMDSDEWEFCIRSGEQTTATGETSVDFTIDNPSKFRCEDMSFEGSDTGAKVSQIWFGDDPVFNPGTGTPVSLFSPSSLMRQQLKGKICPSGARIRVVGTVASAEETLQATFTGQRRKSQSC